MQIDPLSFVQLVQDRSGQTYPMLSVEGWQTGIGRRCRRGASGIKAIHEGFHQIGMVLASFFKDAVKSLNGLIERWPAGICI